MILFYFNIKFYNVNLNSNLIVLMWGLISGKTKGDLWVSNVCIFKDNFSRGNTYIDVTLKFFILFSSII